MLATRINDGRTLKRNSTDIGIKHGLDFSSSKKNKTKQMDMRLDELFIHQRHDLGNRTFIHSKSKPYFYVFLYFQLHLLFVRCLDSFSALYQFIRKSSIIRECYRQLPPLHPFHRTNFNFPNCHPTAFYFTCTLFHSTCTLHVHSSTL